MDLSSGIFIMVVALLVIASLCLGLLISLIAGRRHDTAERRDISTAENRTQENPTQENETQLDRIETLIRIGNLRSLRFATQSIGLVAVIFAGTGLQLDIWPWARVLIFSVGIVAIILAPKMRR